MNNNALNLALKQTARKLCLDTAVVESVYRSYWKFIHEYISNIQDVVNLSKEELNTLNTNFNIPYLGKLYIDYEKIQKYKRHLNYYQNVKTKENQANRLSSVSD